MDGLKRTDADIGLIFLSANAIMYTGEVNDPLYSAHRPLAGLRLAVVANETVTRYLRDEPAAVLGCVLQYQACNSKSPQNRGCTPPSGVGDLLFNIFKMTESEKEANTFAYYLRIALTNLRLNAPYSIAGRLGEWSLTSRYTLNLGVQVQLPDNQWQLDVEHWHEISMASLQGAVVNAATGPSDPSLLEYWEGPQNAEERRICQNTVRMPKNLHPQCFLTHAASAYFTR